MNIIYRGSTPTLIFTIPEIEDNLENIIITFSQLCKVCLSKDINDIQVVENTASVTLTQEDTLKFSSIYPLEVQVKILDGTKVKVSDVQKCDVGRDLLSDVIV